MKDRLCRSLPYSFHKYLDCHLIKNHSFSIGGEYRAQGDDDNENFYEIFSGYFQDVWTIAPPLTLT